MSTYFEQLMSQSLTPNNQHEYDVNHDVHGS